MSQTQFRPRLDASTVGAIRKALHSAAMFNVLAQLDSAVESATRSDEDDAYIEAARDKYVTPSSSGDDQIQIDDDACTSPVDAEDNGGTAGAWVMGWLWVDA